MSWEAAWRVGWPSLWVLWLLIKVWLQRGLAERELGLGPEYWLPQGPMRGAKRSVIWQASMACFSSHGHLQAETLLAWKAHVIGGTCNINLCSHQL